MCDKIYEFNKKIQKIIYKKITEVYDNEYKNLEIYYS